ncbi:unnamed protein product [Prunus armeniaca]
MDVAMTAAKDAEAAKVAVQVDLEESERSKATTMDTAVREAVKRYHLSEEFTGLLDKEVAQEMADLLYRLKQYNPGQKLSLDFAADPPPLPEGVTEEMIEDYEEEGALEGAVPVKIAVVAEDPSTVADGLAGADVGEGVRVSAGEATV